eukprot:8739857-Pyramimonas_sp.AAC.1
MVQQGIRIPRADPQRRLGRSAPESKERAKETTGSDCLPGWRQPAAPRLLPGRYSREPDSLLPSGSAAHHQPGE